MPVLAFAFAAAALAAAALLGAATLRLRGASFAIGAYLLAWAAVVGQGEVLSLLDAVGRAGYVAGGALTLLASSAAWQLRGRPLPGLPRPRLAALLEHPQLTLLGAVVLAAIGYEGFLVVATPPNNADSLAYHLPRVVAWLQQGHAGYFDAPTQRATAFPGNAELGILWTVALLGRDTLVALPQLFAELGVLACVFGCGRRLGFGRPASTFAALLTATLGQVALQSVTAQNDLVTASLVAAAVYFVLGRERRELRLAGLAVALAVGTKLTALLALPFLAVIALAALPRRYSLLLAAWATAAFACFGAFWYVENTIRTHHPLGDVPEADPYRPEHTAGAVVSTAARVSWRFVDFTGVHAPYSLLSGLSDVGEGLFSAAHVAPNPPGATARAFSFRPSTWASEDSSYFGPLGFLLLVPVSLGFLVAWVSRRSTAARGALAASLPLFVLTIAATQSYSPWLGRFMLVPVAVAMALTAWLYERRLRFLTLIAVGIGAASLVGTHLHNRAKPVGLTAEPPIWRMPRIAAETANGGGDARCELQLVNAIVPASAALGVALGTNDPEYLLYDPELRRRLITLRPQDAVREATARGLRWIAVSPFAGPVPAGRWHVENVAGGWRLLTRPTETQPVKATALGDDCRPAPARGPTAS